MKKKVSSFFYIIILFSINFFYKWYSKTNHSGGSLHADAVSERQDRNLLLQEGRLAHLSWFIMYLTRILCLLVISSNFSTKSGIADWEYSVPLCLCSSISFWIEMILSSSQTRKSFGTPWSSSSSSLWKLMAVLRVAGCGLRVADCEVLQRLVTICVVLINIMTSKIRYHIFIILNKI